MNETTTGEVVAVEAKRPTVHALPKYLGRLAAHTEDNGGKFTLGAVRVAFAGDGFVAEAADTKQLTRISGACPVADFEGASNLATAPNGAAGALVAADLWKRAFAGAKKLRRAKAVGCVTGEKVTTFGATDGTGASGESGANVAGRFVPSDELLAKTKKECQPAGYEEFKRLVEGGNAKAAWEYMQGGERRVSLDPELVVMVMKTVIEMQAGDKLGCRVDLHIGNPLRAVRVTARNDDGHELEAIVMPLCG